MNPIDPWVLVKAAWGILVSVLAFIGVWQIRRIDSLEKGSATKQELEAAEKRLDKQIADLRQERRDRDDRLDKRLDTGFDRLDRKLDDSMRSLHARIDEIKDHRDPRDPR